MPVTINGSTGVISPGFDSSGNLVMTGTGLRITGDFSNATIANRVAFQTSTVNSSTSVSVIPNGTNVQSDFFAFNAADPTNASHLLMRSGASETTIRSGITGTGTYLPMTFYTGGSERMRIDTSGNVGIGTSSPSGKLHIAGQTRIQDSASASNYILIGSGSNAPRGGNSVMAQTGSMVMGTESAGPLILVANASERARIDSDGNIQFATTDANNAGPFCRVQLSYAGGGAQYGLGFRPTVDNTIPIWFSNAAAVQVGGISQSTTSTTYSTSSDYRLKENVQPMTGALAKVAALKPVTYTWKANGSDGEGFIAHELQAVVPQCVTGEKDAVDSEGNPIYQGIDTSFLVATLTAAIQELKAIVDAQAVEIAALKGAQA